MADVSLQDIQEVPLTLSDTDAAGNPALPLDAPPTWASSDETVLTLTVASDGMSALALSTGKLGPAQVTVNALASGVALAGSQGFIVTASAATTIGVVAGTPVNK